MVGSVTKTACAFNTLSTNPTNKMIKHTQTIRRLLLKNCLSVFDHFFKRISALTLFKLVHFGTLNGWKGARKPPLPPYV